MSQVTLLTGPERRRRWSEEDRVRILTAALAPGAVVRDVARQFDVSTSLIYHWKREMASAEAGAAGFAPAIVVGEPGAGSASSATAAITVVLARGIQVRIAAHAPAPLVTAVLQTLR